MRPLEHRFLPPQTGARSLEDPHAALVRLEETLEAMRRSIQEVRQRLAEEEARVAELRRDGQPADDAGRLLNEIKETLRLMELHQARFLQDTGGDGA